jgi:hypothetical protein
MICIARSIFSLGNIRFTVKYNSINAKIIVAANKVGG